MSKGLVSLKRALISVSDKRGIKQLAKSLEKNASKMRDLIIESINHARFDETKRIQELIQYSIARNEEAINSNGHGLAMDYAAGGISSFATLNASMFGIKKLQGIKSIINKYGIEKGCNEVVEIIRNIHEKVKRTPSLSLIHI